jgi:Predicted transcriptional regulator
MRCDEVEQKAGFKRSHIYNLIKQGKFPKAKRLGVRAVGWDSLEIKHWIAKRLSQQELEGCACYKWFPPREGEAKLQ